MDKSKIYYYTNDIKEMGEKLKAAKTDDICYIFIADLHNGAYYGGRCPFGRNT